MLQLNKDLEKKIFYGLAGLLFIIMPLLSLTSGISGDEEKFHFPHGKNVYSYYKTLGEDTTCLHYDNSALHMYGPVFDLVTVVAVHIFNAEEEYQVRHILNSLVGWAAIFCAALIAVMLGGWRAGILTLLFMFLSPRFLGHSFNNPKDIPFTAAYIYTIYSIIRFLKYYPDKILKYGWQIALGIGLTIGVRVGGILLAIYFLFFTGIHYILTNHFKSWLQKDNLLKLSKMLLIASGISIVGYAIGILLWPYAHEAPLAKTIEAMKFMEQYAVSLKQVFGGKTIWSDNVPLSYLPRYIFMTLPEFVMLGFILFFTLFRKWQVKNNTWYFILLFISIFPIIYVIYKESNVYGGWRHIMFVFPGIAILAAVGFNNLLELSENKWLKYGMYGFLLLLFAMPIRHIIKNHPHEYIYYNTISGGVDKAYGKYEMDYFFHTLRAGSEWLIENKINTANLEEGEKIVVATNLSINTQYYFRNMKDKVKVIYVRYYERGNKDWDYAILANSGVNPHQLRRGVWPPANTIETIDQDGVPICAIVERKDRNDLEGYNLQKVKNNAAAIPFFLEAIRKDPKYEQQHLNLAKAYLDINQPDKAIASASKCLKLYPNYDRALMIMGMGYLNKGDNENAFKVFRRNMKLNPKNVASYYYSGLIYAQTEDYKTALKYLEQAITVNGRYKPSYYLAARIYELTGESEMAKRYTDYANSIP